MRTVKDNVCGFSISIFENSLFGRRSGFGENHVEHTSLIFINLSLLLFKLYNINQKF
jgi:hypothetical protein